MWFSVTTQVPTIGNKTVMCPDCMSAADNGKFGVENHYEYGCPSISKSLDPKTGFPIFQVDKTLCNCQHRDDIPKEGLQLGQIG